MGQAGVDAQSNPRRYSNSHSDSHAWHSIASKPDYVSLEDAINSAGNKAKKFKEQSKKRAMKNRQRLRESLERRANLMERTEEDIRKQRLRQEVGLVNGALLQSLQHVYSTLPSPSFLLSPSLISLHPTGAQEGRPDRKQRDARNRQRQPQQPQLHN